MLFRSEHTIIAKGENGKDGVTINGKDGSITIDNGKNGADGANAKITVANGTPGVDGTNGITRVIYTDKDGNNKHEVATLDDGIKFVGNSGDKALKLNKQFTIQGATENKNTAGSTDKWDTFDKGANIMTLAENDGTENNGKLTIALAKALKGLTSAEFVGGGTDGGKTVINGDGVSYNKADNLDTNGAVKDPTKTVSIGKDGISAGGKTISNVGEAQNATDAVSKKQAETIANNAVKTLTDNIADGTKVYFNAEADDTATTGSKKVANTKNIKFEGDDNVKTSIEQEADGSKTTVKFTLNTKDLNLGGKDSTDDGKIAVNGADGKSGVAINGKDGVIDRKSVV